MVNLCSGGNIVNYCKPVLTALTQQCRIVCPGSWKRLGSAGWLLLRVSSSCSREAAGTAIIRGFHWAGHPECSLTETQWCRMSAMNSWGFQSSPYTQPLQVTWTSGWTKIELPKTSFLLKNLHSLIVQCPPTTVSWLKVSQDQPESGDYRGMIRRWVSGGFEHWTI